MVWPDRPIRVLLVEDDEDDYVITRDLLAEQRGARVDLVWAAGRGAALACLDQQTPDICLVDYRLGAHNGLDVAADIRDRFEHVPVIMLTGQEDDYVDAAAAAAGISDYLVKASIDANMLIRAIRYAMQREVAMTALRDSEERYALALDGANDGLWDWSVLDDELYISPRWSAMLGIEHDGQTTRADALLAHVHPDDREHVRSLIAQHLEGRSPHLESEHRVLHADGGVRWVLLRGVARRNASGQAVRMAGSMADITARKEAEERLIHDAFHDDLTGLPNRPLLLDRLGMAVARSRRSSGSPSAVLFLDLDQFKVINDSLGHDAGDNLLIEVSKRLTDCVRGSDTIARIGGDEFTILLEPIGSPLDAEEAAARIQAALEQPLELEGQRLHVRASIGITLCDGDSEAAEILRDADTAMYRAKSAGGARHQRFYPEMRRAAIARLALETDLRRALDERTLELHYQPIVRLSSGEITGFEALARWSIDDRVVSPAEFIPVAEETGLIVELGRWALHEACRQLAQWRESGVVDAQTTVSVNVSGRQFVQSDIVADVRAALDHSNLPGANLRLELTESVIVEEPELVFNRLDGALAPLGVRAHIDDFGTGYSSLSFLRRFPAEALKIDRSFVAALDGDDGGRELVAAIASLGATLHRTVIAEGIETEAQRQALVDLQVTFGQGWLFAPALPPARVPEFVRGWRSQSAAA